MANPRTTSWTKGVEKMPGGNGLSRYRLVVSQEPSDLEWDDFVATAIGGAYQQSSMWAQVKAVLGWRCARLVLRGPEGIIAGCQVLLRPVPWVGAIAYVPRGPLVAGHDPWALESLLEALHELAAQERILYLKVQPPPGRDDMVVVLRARGFVKSTLDVAPAVTVRVDLDRSLEALLAAMRHNTRTNILKAQRLGVQVREGGEADLGTFTQLLGATARRQGFSPHPRTYYEQMWRTFAARGHAHLLIAEHDGVALSSNFLLGYGDSTVYKAGGWSGTRGNIRPNELLHWAGMQWGRARRHRYYDFEGFKRSIGQALLSEHPPDLSTNGVANFKLGFGGDVTAFPGTYDRAYRLPLAGALRRFAPQLDRLMPLAHRALDTRWKARQRG
jgi:lipid II:glycine glycyltransferase (peptidoglycan interpeptide bridge formation enzyme)